MQRTPFPLPVCPPPHRPGSEASPVRAGQAAQQRAFSAKLYRDFWNFSVDEASNLLEQKEPEYWERKGEQLALALFHAAAERVPSHKLFFFGNGLQIFFCQHARGVRNI